MHDPAVFMAENDSRSVLPGMTERLEYLLRKVLTEKA
jgi:hypothetical protein